MRSCLTHRIATGIPSIGSLLPLICGSTVCLGSSLGYKSVPECCEASAKWISACAPIAVARGAPQQFCQDLLSSCPPRLQLAAPHELGVSFPDEHAGDVSMKTAFREARAAKSSILPRRVRLNTKPKRPTARRAHPRPPPSPTSP